ncbi:MAG: hypothetical protein K2N34_09090 [Lachnospiraceae bacterium]|nr:hypothetical protein [Lachnospiraceae bacterium]
MKGVFNNKTKRYEEEVENDIAKDIAEHTAKNFEETLEAIIEVKIYSKFCTKFNSKTKVEVEVLKDKIDEITNAINKHLDIFFGNLCNELNLAEEIDGLQIREKTIRVIEKENTRNNKGLQSFSEKIKIVGEKDE